MQVGAGPEGDAALVGEVETAELAAIEELSESTGTQVRVVESQVRPADEQQPKSTVWELQSAPDAMQAGAALEEDDALLVAEARETERLETTVDRPIELEAAPVETVELYAAGLAIVVAEQTYSVSVTQTTSVLSAMPIVTELSPRAIAKIVLRDMLNGTETVEEGYDN